MSETKAETLQYRCDGPEDAPVLVLGPALGTTWHMWDRQIPELTRHWRVVRFDLPGHGGAPAAPAASVDDLGDRLVATLDSLGVDRFGYAGCSLSAAIGIDLALRHPHRLASLALIAASPRYGTPDSWRQRGETVRREGLDPVARSAPERWFTANFSGAQPAIVDWAVQMVGTTDTYAYVAACDALAAFDVRAELTRISVPALVIVGAEDTTTPPADARVLVAGIHDAKLAVVPGASHLTPVEQPAAVTDLLVRHFTTAWQLSTQQGMPVLPGASAPAGADGPTGPGAAGAGPGLPDAGSAGAGFGADGPGTAGSGVTSSGAAAGAGGIAHPGGTGPARGGFGAPGSGFGAPGSGMPGPDFGTPPGGTGGPASGPAPGAGPVSATTPGSGIPGPAGTPAPGPEGAGSGPGAGFGTPGAASGGGFGAPGSGPAVPGGAAVTGPDSGRTGDGFGAFAPGSGPAGAPGPAGSSVSGTGPQAFGAPGSGAANGPGPAGSSVSGTGPQAFGTPGYGPGTPGTPGTPGSAGPGADTSGPAVPGSGMPGPGGAGGAAFAAARGAAPGARGSDTVRITPGTGAPDGARIPSDPGVPDTVRINPGPPPGSGAHAFGAAGLPAAEPAAAAEPGAAGPFGRFGPPPADLDAESDALDRGGRIRRDVLGDEAADRAEADRDAFTADFHDLVTRSAWGGTWARPGLDRRTRALLTLTALTARGHYDDIAPYTRAALRSGAGPDEIKETLLHAAVYCGLPAAGAAFAVAQRVIAEEAGPRA
ncbi:alpha/beta fold hydrolase [Streptomyces sp. XH2]|uniref:alpha/beta fold hydrolase n=1 Tax=Streptomyces sp. XH2 TaxID=3412483 RepID=UPI003C7DF846